MSLPDIDIGGKAGNTPVLPGLSILVMTSHYVEAVSAGGKLAEYEMCHPVVAVSGGGSYSQCSMDKAGFAETKTDAGRKRGTQVLLIVEGKKRRGIEE